MGAYPPPQAQQQYGQQQMFDPNSIYGAQPGAYPMGQMPGMPQMPGGMGHGGSKKARGKQTAKSKRKGGKSGNPAKRAQQAQGVREPEKTGASFGGFDVGQEQFDPSQLPKGFGGFMGKE